jgi:predicted enzyme related to lactoylglutathione lyase
LRTVIYKVENIAKAKEWYSKAFQTEPYFDEVFYVSFNIAGYEPGLQPSAELSLNKAESVSAYWDVDNVDEAYKNLLA